MLRRLSMLVGCPQYEPSKSGSRTYPITWCCLKSAFPPTPISWLDKNGNRNAHGWRERITAGEIYSIEQLAAEPS
jgi:hypothetical protein